MLIFNFSEGKYIRNSGNTKKQKICYNMFFDMGINSKNITCRVGNIFCNFPCDQGPNHYNGRRKSNKSSDYSGK